MNSEHFSFSKKPVYSHAKRHSVISDIIPNSSESNGNNYTTTTADTNNKRTNSGRTFSSISNGDGNLIRPCVSPDDPLLDYDEQIRVPKFQSKKSLDDIGSVSVNFESNDLMDKSQQESKLNSRRATTNIDSSILPKSTTVNNTNKTSNPKSTYQPAKFDIGHFSISESHSSSSSPPRQTTSSSLGDKVYNIESYLNNKNSSNVISNHEPSQHPSNVNLNSTTNSSSYYSTPLPSKKNSNESIYQFTSKNTLKFSMAPLRPIDDPKVPNYVPCVLRTTSDLINPSSFNSPLSPFNTSNSAQTLSDLTNNEDSIETTGNELSHEHWKPNNSVTNCTDCNRIFTLINRRHHCRKCGLIFCSNCLLSKSKLNYNCEFDIDGILAKVCFNCNKQWSNFLINNFKQVDKQLFPDSLKKTNQDVITNINDDHHQEQLEMEQNPLGEDKREAGTTVPADWSWSSF
ncbi:Myoneurin [Wickerhamomyces ciferrii]|uniref:Myoneurin n=1 Tax=Wickerhamomyces ciferrii (strain ATCC 14091 / BCRC 22168 / CBS 111 / JCM 3599 / NBRC 0793 / NRRL Y-1031 F-60-10) TaxID=1206466 RepID=K0KJJ2_WICCF|nr:Myoneurin [Wickerhamomyces ciferrii]CCH45430.1 Myoneurin [Wickerhamomyces ciferrii]